MQRSNKSKKRFNREDLNSNEESYPKTTCKLVYINYFNFYTKIKYTSEVEKSATGTIEKNSDKPSIRQFWKLFFITIGLTMLFGIINSQTPVPQFLQLAYFILVMALSVCVNYYCATTKMNLIASIIILVCLSVSLGAADPGAILKEYRQKIDDKLFPPSDH